MEKPTKGIMMGVVEDDDSEAHIAVTFMGMGTVLLAIPAAVAMLEQLDLLLEQVGAFDADEDEDDMGERVIQ